MLFTSLCSVLFVAQLLVAVLATPSPLLDSTIDLEDRSLQARAPIVKFHVCTDVIFRGDCYTVSTEPLTIQFSSTGCVDFKPGVASNIRSIRVLDTWNYALEIHEDVSCNGAGVSIIDSSEDLGTSGWANRAKSARVYYFPVDHNSYPSAVE